MALALSSSVLAAHAAITQVPEQVQQVLIQWPDLDPYLGDRLTGVPPVYSQSLEAFGHSVAEGRAWMADVSEVSGQVIRLGGDNTGFKLTYTWPEVGTRTHTWMDVAIDVGNQRVTADEYVDGVRVSDDQLLLYVWSFGIPNPVEGKALVQWGNYVGVMTLVSAVPEPSAGLAMALGLIGMGGIRLRARRPA
ncbi:MAG: PEP-CTERM sorting domain-containing protein [Aquabacterium sp.]